MAISLSVFSYKDNLAGPPSEPRGRECWVFRSVLDGNPRMLTAALSKDVWVSYSTQTGQLYKVWKKGVKFSGPAFDSKHGPQPVSKDGIYWQEAIGSSPYLIKDDKGKEVSYKFQFLGYKNRGDEEFFWEAQLKLASGTVLKVKEKPEVSRDLKTGQPSLLREFSVEGLPAGFTLDVIVKGGAISDLKKDIVTQGVVLDIKQRSEKVIGPKISAYAFDGVLALSQNKTALISVKLNPSFAQ